MKKTVLLIIMCLASLASMAQNGWQYLDNGCALIISDLQYFSGYDADPTCLGVMVGEIDGKPLVIVGLDGDKSIHDIRDNQQYVVVSFELGKSVKWRIKPFEGNGSKFQYVAIVNSELFLKRLRTAEYFSITLPVFGVGNTTFYFTTGGYPLDW